MARTVVFDFDGVIHSYTSGWKGETNIPDPPVPGIQEALKEIHDAGYEVVVVSTRCKTVLGRMAIENWLDMYGMTQEVDKVCKEKPPAIAYIDDRAICFDGHPETLLKKIQNFQPWYKMPTLTPPNEPLTCGLVDRHGMPLRAGDTVAADKFFVYAVRYGSHNVNPDNCAPAYQVGWYLEIMWAYPGFEDSVGHTEPLYDIDGTAARYPAHCADTADGLYNLKLEVCCRQPEGDANA